MPSFSNHAPISIAPTQNDLPGVNKTSTLPLHPMATEEAIAAGLIDWVNSLAVAPPVYTVEDLNNGHVIWKVLRKTPPPVVISSSTLSHSRQIKSTASAFLANSPKTQRSINGSTSGPTSNTSTMPCPSSCSKTAARDSRATAPTSKQSPNHPPCQTSSPSSNSSSLPPSIAPNASSSSNRCNC